MYRTRLKRRARAGRFVFSEIWWMSFPSARPHDTRARDDPPRRPRRRGDRTARPSRRARRGGDPPHGRVVRAPHASGCASSKKLSVVERGAASPSSSTLRSSDRPSPTPSESDRRLTLELPSHPTPRARSHGPDRGPVVREVPRPVVRPLQSVGADVGERRGRARLTIMHCTRICKRRSFTVE